MSRPFSTRLYDLIHSLSRSEKRYFTIFASRHVIGSSNKYIQLFEVLAHQETFDPQTAQAAIYAQPVQTNKFLELSRYLYKLILKSLRSYHQSSSVRMQVQNLIQNIEILYKKSLYSQCREQLKKAHKLTQQYELHLLELELLHWQKKLAYAESNVPLLRAELPQLVQAEQKHLEAYQSLSTYWKLFFDMYIHVRQYAVVRDPERLAHLQEFMQHHALQKIMYTDYFQIQLLYKRIYSLYFFSIGDAERYYTDNKALLAFAQKHWNQVKEDPTQYISIITNLVYSCVYLHRYHELPTYLDLFKSVPITSLDDQIKITNQYHLNKLHLYTQNGDFQAGYPFIQKVEKARNKLPQRLYEASYFTLYGYICFGAQAFEEALDWFNRLLDVAKEEQRSDLQTLARVMRLIIHLELDHHLLLEYLQRNTYRYLRKRDRLFAFERHIIRFVQQARQAPNKRARQTLYQGLKQQLQKVKDDPNEKVVFQYFDFMTWVDAKIQMLPFAKLCQQRFQALKPNEPPTNA